MPSSLALKVEIEEPELIVPSKQTPHEFKTLSDLDNTKSLQVYSKGVSFYENDGKMEGRDPVEVIKQAIAHTLVHYYPVAGRLRQFGNGKLAVECTGEGILYLGANANVSLEQLCSGVILPPVPGAKDLLLELPHYLGCDKLHSPLVMFQVTRFTCGRYAVATQVNHLLFDAYGFTLFLSAVAEMACGVPALSVSPVWERELLNARDPPQISSEHHVYQEIQGSKLVEEVVMQVEFSFFFGPQQISIIKSQLPPEFHKYSNFEILSAFLWRCQTLAQNFNSEDVVHIAFTVNIREKLNPPLPLGYYGNASVKQTATSTVGELRRNLLGYAVGLVRKAKERVTEEYVRSTVDFLVKNGGPRYYVGDFIFHVSYLTSLGFNNVDYGLGKVVYSGRLIHTYPYTYFVASRNSEGEDGTVVMISLPGHTMGKFIGEMEKWVRVPKNMNTPFLASTL